MKLVASTLLMLSTDVIFASLSDSSITTICGMIVIVITQLAVSFALWVKMRESEQKISGVAKTTDNIHQLTNSTMTEMRDELKAARVEIKEIQQMRVNQAMSTMPPVAVTKNE